jgi:Right handed beta helix region
VKGSLPLPRFHAVLATLAIFCLALLTGGPSHAGADSGCTKVAAPGGSDDAEGTEDDPYHSLEELVEELDAGEVGCLRAGTYGGDSVYFEAPGAELRSYPGELATITAFMEVVPEAAGAHIHHLRFDASHHDNDVGIKLQADQTQFTDNELTKGGNGICLLAGTYHPAAGVVIERNRIYDCGPASSKFMHQIYLQNTRGAIVRWNILTGNAGGWGVHLYANADDTVITHNIIDGNHGGVIFAGDDEATSDRNVVRYNAITYSQQRWNLEGSWSDAGTGSDNRALRNCVYSNGEDAPSGIEEEDGGFAASANLISPGSPYVARSRGDYRFDPDSRCAKLVGDVVGVIAGTVLPAPEAEPHRGRASTGRGRVALVALARATAAD